MKKRLWMASAGLVMAMSCGTVFTACSSVEIEDVPQIEQRAALCVDVVLDGQSTRAQSGPLTAWMDGDEVGLFLLPGESPSVYDSPAYRNVRMLRQESEWHYDELLLTKESAGVCAYYPWKASEDPKAVGITLDQTDYLYGSGKSVVSYAIPSTLITMHHAMTQFALFLKRGTYQGTGRIQSVRLSNREGAQAILDGGLLDVTTGNIFGGKPADLQLGTGEMTLPFSSGQECSVASIMVPFSPIGEGDVRLEVQVDSERYYYNLPAGTAFAAGKCNIIHATVNSASLDASAADISIEPWQVIRQSSGDLYEIEVGGEGEEDSLDYLQASTASQDFISAYSPSWWKGLSSNLSISPRATTSKEEMFEAEIAGNMGDVYSGRPARIKVNTLGFFNPGTRGSIALVFLDESNRIVSNSYSQSLDTATGTWTGYEWFMDMNLIPGRYKVIPVMRFEGSSSWILPSYVGYSSMLPFGELDDVSYEVWGIEVKADRSDLLMLYNVYDENYERVMSQTGGWCSGTGIEYVNTGQEVSLKYVLSNPSARFQSGTLTWMDIRSFEKGFLNPLDEALLESYSKRKVEWKREIGRQHIRIKEGTLLAEGEMKGVLSQPNHVEYCGGSQYLFFTPDGDSRSYLLMRDERAVMAPLQNLEMSSWWDFCQNRIYSAWTTQYTTDAWVDDAR